MNETHGDICLKYTFPEQDSRNIDVDIADENAEHNLLLGHTDFHKPVTVSKSDFENISLSLSTFRQAFNFSGLVVNSTFFSKWTSFMADSEIVYSMFHEGVDFYYTRFYRDFLFYKNNCQSACLFIATTFLGAAKLASNQYNGPVDFEGAVFHKSADLSDNVFIGPVNFSQVEFRGDVDFDHDLFKETVSFKYASFLGSTSFVDVVFPNYVDFSHVNKIGGIVTL